MRLGLLQHVVSVAAERVGQQSRPHSSGCGRLCQEHAEGRFQGHRVPGQSRLQ